ncbi:hypothetical protein L1887_03685 [Cichorium endivia]|nr:hypothetical protein L1887_03685 [Cichorium endivia]
MRVRFEEARKHKRETYSSRSAIDNLHFKVQKPISKDDTSKKIKKTHKRWWWKNALHFFKRKSTSSSDSSYNNLHCVYDAGGGVRAVSGSLYLVDSRSGSSALTTVPPPAARRPDHSQPHEKVILTYPISVSPNSKWSRPTRYPAPP